jgi:large subunit ribosomal protein L3
MPVGLLGRKVGMTQVYGENGVLIPVTVIEAGPCPVLMLRSKERDGYEAVQIGFGIKPRRLAIRSERGHVAALSSKRAKSLEQSGKSLLPKANCEPPRYVREFRLDGEEHSLEVGQVLDVNLFAEVKSVDVIGITKGRGFTGAMKRWNFQGQNASHGEKKVHRRVGSIGNRSYPGRVFKGLKMAGHYGVEQVTIRNLSMVKIDTENNLIVIKGAIPGANGGHVIIRPTNYVS